MTFNGWIQIAIYFAVLTALVVPLGRYMARVFEGERTFLSPVLRPIELLLYRAAGVDESREQHWLTYTFAMLLFNAAGFVVLYGLLRIQNLLPPNPADQSAVAPELSFNTAVSFTSNTNWQNYGGESTLSYLSQMVGLTTQNFVAVRRDRHRAAACADPAFARTSAKTVGNFWVDLTRSTLYVLFVAGVGGEVPAGAVVAVGEEAHAEHAEEAVDAVDGDGADRVVDLHLVVDEEDRLDHEDAGDRCR